MAKEKFIRGKKDNAKHAGKYANTKRRQAADFQIKEWKQGKYDKKTK